MGPQIYFDETFLSGPLFSVPETKKEDFPNNLLQETFLFSQFLAILRKNY